MSLSLPDQSRLEFPPVFDAYATREIPLLGVVAAGQPYQAFTVEESLSVPTTLWGGRRVFALRVRGNSMVDDGIYNGDFLIVEPQPSADNGQTVVAEVDGSVTVKLFHRDGDGQVRLQPANPDVLPLVVRADRVRVIGIVVGVLRKFGAGPKSPTHGAVSPASRPDPTPRTRAPKHAPPLPDTASIDLAVNAIDRQLLRWHAAMEVAQNDRVQRARIPQMAELERNLQALRDWCSRTNKPGLRRALIAEANKLMQRMQRLASCASITLADFVLH